MTSSELALEVIWLPTGQSSHSPIQIQESSHRPGFSMVGMSKNWSRGGGGGAAYYNTITDLQSLDAPTFLTANPSSLLEINPLYGIANFSSGSFPSANRHNLVLKISDIFSSLYI